MSNFYRSCNLIEGNLASISKISQLIKEPLLLIGVHLEVKKLTEVTSIFKKIRS